MTKMKIIMRQPMKTRLRKASMLSWAPAEEALEGFEGVDIEDIHVGAGLIGFKVDPVLTYNVILVGLD